MKAVILAAGRGTRLMPLTQNTAKTLVEYAPGKTILGTIIDSLPKSIDHIILVIHAHAQKIKDFIKAEYSHKKISFVFQKKLDGTYNALFSAKSLLGEDPFLVLSGDDLLDPVELQNFLDSGAQVCVQRRNMPARYNTIELNNTHQIVGLRPQTDTEIQNSCLIVTGTYILDFHFFSFQIQKNFQGEQGIPHTLFQKGFVYDYFEMNNWYPINTLDDIKNLQKEIFDGIQ